MVSRFKGRIDVIRLQRFPETMRVLTILFVLLNFALAHAHQVNGTVQILLKGDKKKQDVSSVIVYLEQADGSAKNAGGNGKREFEMATKNKQFQPRSLAVPVGAVVSFPNMDPIYHNLFSVSSPNQFDLGLYKGGESKKRSFDSPGIVRVFCNVHPQMTATIIVSNTPYFTSADKNGNYSLANIPSGIFLVKAFSEEGQAVEKIEIKDQPLTVPLTIDARNFKKLPHKNKFGKDYSADDNEGY
jgi:plastocyanin